MKMKKLLSLLLASALSISMLASCSSSNGDEEEIEEAEEEDKGAIVEMYFGEKMPDDFDPTTFPTSSDEYQLTSILYEGLTGVDKNGKVYGLGASEWDYEIDELDGELKLLIKLKSTKWSDSIPVRADDYVFAWKKLLSPANDNPAAMLLYPIKNAKKVKSGEVTVADIGASALNNNTLEIVFEDTEADVEYFLKCLASPMLVPLREDKVKHDKWSTQLDLLVTNGPFAIKSISEDRLIIERSTHYNSLRTRQALDTYVKPYRLIVYYGDEAKAIEQYNSSDLATKYYFLGNLSKDSAAAFGSSVKYADELATYTYFFNTDNEVLASAETRKALSAALDRQAIAEIRGAGAEAATGLVPNGVMEANSKKSFREAGGDLLSALSGSVAKKGSVKITYNEDRAYEAEIAKLARDAWKELGISVQLDPVPGDQIDDVIKSGEFDVIAADYIALTNDAYGFVAPFALQFSGSYVDVTNPDVFYNPHFTGFESDEYNALIDEIYATESAKEKAPLLHKAEEMLLAESPVAPLFFEKSNYVASKDLSKYEVTYRGTMDFRNMKLKGYKKVNEAKVAAEEAEEVAAK